MLLEEIGRPYALQRLNFAADEQHQPPFLALNPKGKVPTLVRDDGSVLTEFAAIAWWLAPTYPQANLLPRGRGAAGAGAGSHGLCGRHAARPGLRAHVPAARFTTVEADQDQVKAQGREIFATGMRLLDAALAGKDWVAGSFSVADAALFYVEHWAGRMAIELPANCAAHKARMLARPAVARAMEQEGIAG